MSKREKIILYQSLLEYIKGKRKGKDANRIEREAMTDAFLCEALEGADAVEDNHLKNIESLHTKIMKRASMRKKWRQRKIMIWGAAASINSIFTWSEAACASLVIAGGLIYFSTSESGDNFAISEHGKTYGNNDFISKIQESKKEIIEEELLPPIIIAPPVSQNAEVYEIDSENISIVSKNTAIKEILNFAEDSIAAEKQKIEYVNPRKLEPENYADEYIPFAVVEEQPKFMGKDANAFSDWVQKRIKYPENAYVQGQVILSFVIE